MLAFLLTIGLFIFFLLIGYPIIHYLHDEDSTLQNMLLAPGIGVAVVTLLVFLLNWFGLPVISFTHALTVLLAISALVGCCLVFYKKGMTVTFREYLPFGAILFAALLFVSYPMFLHGFYWMSVANDDMANYALAATRLLYHGYHDFPDMDRLVGGWDYSLVYYAFVVAMFRPGPELLLAWISGLTGLNAHHAYMPLIMALHIVLISTASTFLLKYSRILAITFCAFMAVSSQLAWGAVYQLLAQVGGMALLCVGAVLVMRKFDFKQYSKIVRYAFLLALVVAPLMVFYTEIVPFLGLGVIIYYGSLFVRGWRPSKSFWSLVGTSIAFVVLFLNNYIYFFFNHLFAQFAQAGLGASEYGVVDQRNYIFPFFLRPSGLPTLFGISHIFPSSNIIFLQILIILGVVLFIFSVIATVVLIAKEKENHFFVCIWAGMFMMAVYLFAVGQGFGLYKLAMFAQPFLYSTILLAVYISVRNIRVSTYRYVMSCVAVIILVFVFVANAYAKQGTVVTSAFGGGVTEIPLVSQNRIIRRMSDEVERLENTERPIISDTSNLIAHKFKSLYTRGIQTFFPGIVYQTVDWLSAIINDDWLIARESEFVRYSGDVRLLSDAFTYLDIGNLLQNAKLFLSGSNQSIFNRSNPYMVNIDEFKISNNEDVHNWLIFIRSELSQPNYFPQDRANVSLFQPEHDVFFSGRTFSAIGRHFMLQAWNFVPDSRVVFEYTATLNRDGENIVPNINIFGEDKSITQGAGRGSARLFSQPIQPQRISGMDYIQLEVASESRQLFGADGDGLRGLQNLWGHGLYIDNRFLTGFARNISLITEEAFNNMIAPSYISQFPWGLADINLEYSGIYEDGWASEEMFFMLQQNVEHNMFRVSGWVPNIGDMDDFQTVIHVLVEGEEVIAKTLGVGDFEIEAELQANTGRKRVDVFFTEKQRLPRGDGRLTPANITFIGFEGGYNDYN